MSGWLAALFRWASAGLKSFMPVVTVITTMPNATRLTRRSHAIDNSDWLKAAAIILVVVDHFGYFFVEDADWWSVFGRLAAPVFFFLMGYAQTRKVPLSWLGLGIILTALESWNADWSWVAPNILLSLALIRVVRPFVQSLAQKFGWIAFLFFVSALFLVLPVSAEIADYGAEGWFWALFGFYQRMYVDNESVSGGNNTAKNLAFPLRGTVQKTGLMRMLACLVAAAIYVWQEQLEFSFALTQFSVFIVAVGVLSVILCFFRRGPSRIQPSEPLAGILHFTGRHTLEIYAIQLAGSELIVKFVPELAA